MKTGLFIGILIIGELLINPTIFSYLKRYFKMDKGSSDGDPIFGISISLFKGMLERFLIYLALVHSISQILVVFGAIKLGTRLDASKSAVTNDYFLIGNFISILTAIGYYIIFNWLSTEIHFQCPSTSAR